jgi:hypothetical protein
LPNQELLVIRIVISRIELRLSGGISTEREDGWRFETSDPQPNREIKTTANFFIFSAVTH